MEGRCFNVLLINVLVQFPCEQNSNDDVDSDSDASYTVENEDDPDDMDISDEHIEVDTVKWGYSGQFFRIFAFFEKCICESLDFMFYLRSNMGKQIIP